MSFDIADHLDKLTPAKGRNRYYCPVCGNDNFTIDPKTTPAKYQCWNGCTCKEIRDMIAPLPEKTVQPRQEKTWEYYDRDGDPLIQVVRKDDGSGKKKIYQKYWFRSNWQPEEKVPNEVKQQAKESVLPYRYSEAIKHDRIFFVEGEKCADALWALGLAAVTTIAGCNCFNKYGDYSGLFEGKELAICPDQDAPGIKYAEDVAALYPEARWLYAFPTDPRWEKLPAKGGLDIADWIAQGATKEQILAAVGERREASEAEPSKTGRPRKVEPVESDIEPTPELRFNQQVVSDLYSDPAQPWICVAGQLYQWTGNYYKKSDDDIELKRIAEFANSFSVVNRGRTTYPYASAACVKSAIEWVKIQLAVPIDQCNPEGLNCTNGVLIFDEHHQPRLEPHSPDSYFLYKPNVAYTPDADSEACDRLLAALRPDQVQVFLKTIAAIFNIQKARQKVGRIRALLAIGTGSNGKDALREAVSLLFGRTAITSVSLEDFASYDAGRKFDCSPLINSVINWASENRPGINLDKLKSLMRAITGEALHFELKNKDSREFQPNAIQIFNLNEVPNIKAAMQATKTRFAVCNFDKTYKVGADPSKGELEADTRLKYDSEYVIQNVLPALLNYLVKAYQDLMVEGIDYSSCDQALEEIQIQNSHLFEFALETGLTFDPDAVLPIGDLWLELERHYQQTGVLTINSDGSKVWEDPIRPGDLYVKGANQIPNRFLALYPQAKKVSLGGNRFGLKGLRFGTKPATPDDEPDLAARISRLVAERLEGIDPATVDPVLIADQIAAQLTQQPVVKQESAPEPEPAVKQEPESAPAVSVDSDWQPRPGERVWAWDSDQKQWQQAEVLIAPNQTAKDPNQRTGFWRVRLATGAEPYIWNRTYLAPLNHAA